jgi:hypothetical protein
MPPKFGRRWLASSLRPKKRLNIAWPSESYDFFFDSDDAFGGLFPYIYYSLNYTPGYQ